MLRRALGRRLSGASPWAVDAVITAVVQVAVTIPFVVPRPADLPPATWAMYGLTSLQVLPLLWRTRAPLASLLAITVAGFGYLIVDGPGQPLPYSPIVAIFTVAAQAGRRPGPSSYGPIPTARRRPSTRSREPGGTRWHSCAGCSGC
ncbi:DUF7134 domain-containing protein [Streptomyces syringium]|uniref:DUF7134 domain-containing protein n=1 Tax=Streptomyces syringium TaxID=76729 RepID=UPI0034431A2D